MKLVIEKTSDGSDTLRHPVTGDTYHSLRGAAGESRHVFIENGLAAAWETMRSRGEGAVGAGSRLSATGGNAACLPQGCSAAVAILEVGFGSGLNAWLSLEYARMNGLSIDYTAIELYPVAMETVRQLNYTEEPLFVSLHESPWEERCLITDRFALTKRRADFADIIFDRTFDLVYFDAFAPATQPELWLPEQFVKLYGAMNYGAVLVTYSAAGEVKRALAQAGFCVERLAGALGKRHMLRAVKK